MFCVKNLSFLWNCCSSWELLSFKIVKSIWRWRKVCLQKMHWENSEWLQKCLRSYSYGTQQGSGKCSMNSFENTRRGSIPVLGLLSSTGVTPKVKWQKKHLLWKWDWRSSGKISTNRALFSDQYSELDNKITSLIKIDPDRKEFTIDQNAFTYSSVTLCCSVYCPISVTSRFWMFDIHVSQLKCLCQALLSTTPLPLLSCLEESWYSGYPHPKCFGLITSDQTFNFACNHNKYYYNCIISEIKFSQAIDVIYY